MRMIYHERLRDNNINFPLQSITKNMWIHIDTLLDYLNIWPASKVEKIESDGSLMTFLHPCRLLPLLSHEKPRALLAFFHTPALQLLLQEPCYCTMTSKHKLTQYQK